MNLLSVENLEKNFGERILFKNLSFGLNRGDKIALIANNGTGKSSMLKILAGIDNADNGKVIFRNSKSSLRADVVEVNIKTRDIKIFMYEDNKKVNIKTFK